jgi:hemerythrin superfamily protein
MSDQSPYFNHYFSKTLATMVGHSALWRAIQEDHQEMYDYFESYQKAHGDHDAQQRFANLLMWEVARHAVGEEIVVYPLLEKHLGAEGKRLADHDREDHQKVKELLFRLDKLQAGHQDFDSTLKQVIDHLRPHNDSEEQTDLPQLEAKMTTEDLEKAAADFRRTKRFAPTRPHPNAPNKPPAETIVGFLALPIDKLRDAFTSFPTDEDQRKYGA